MVRVHRYAGRFALGVGVNLLIFQIIKNVFGRELLAKLRRINTLVLSANMVG